MSVQTVNKDELFEVMQHTNIVRVRFGSNSNMAVFPILYSSYDSVDIINKSDDYLHVGDKVIFKFQQMGFEYIVNGKIMEKRDKESCTTTITYIKCEKYNNLRKHMRFDINAKALLKCPFEQVNPSNSIILDDSWYESTVKNISKGGVMVYTEIDLDVNSIIEMEITFGDGKLWAIAKILRKFTLESGKFSYGMKFVNIDENGSKVLERQITKLEKKYFKSLDILRDYKKMSDIIYESKIALFTKDKDESYDLRENLIKIGASNFDVIKNFTYYHDFLQEERPKVVILDVENIEKDIISIMAYINNELPGTKVFLVFPIENQKKVSDDFYNNTEILYKPLIYNEFEDKIIKYL